MDKRLWIPGTIGVLFLGIVTLTLCGSTDLPIAYGVISDEGLSSVYGGAVEVRRSCC